jgi:ABC-type Na+ transport system ATPase subunit NatA
MPEDSMKSAWSNEARRIQTEIYRNMTGEKKLQISYELYQFARMLVKASILEFNPGISREDLTREMIRRFSR